MAVKSYLIHAKSVLNAILNGANSTNHFERRKCITINVSLYTYVQRDGLAQGPLPKQTDIRKGVAQSAHMQKCVKTLKFLRLHQLSICQAQKV